MQCIQGLVYRTGFIKEKKHSAHITMLQESILLRQQESRMHFIYVQELF